MYDSVQRHQSVMFVCPLSLRLCIKSYLNFSDALQNRPDCSQYKGMRPTEGLPTVAARIVDG